MMDAATRAQLKARLDEAELAYHRLMLGQQAKVFVDQNGERVEYSSATALQLSKYIAELKRQLGLGGITGPLDVYM